MTERSCFDKRLCVCLHRGYPQLAYGGTPIWLKGVPPSFPTGGGYPHPSHPIGTGWGYPLCWDWMGVPSQSQDWMRVPCQSQDWMGLPPNQHSSRASTCYVAGGMPLVFTQKDFLVLYIFALIHEKISG